MLYIFLGLLVLGITYWDYRNEEADFLFWMDWMWWDVNKTEHPIFYKLALIGQVIVGLGLITWGVLAKFIFH